MVRASVSAARAASKVSQNWHTAQGPFARPMQAIVCTCRCLRARFILAHLIQQLCHLTLKEWDVVRRSVPNHVEVYAEVAVDEDVTHSSDGAPGNFGVALSPCRRNVIDSLTNELDTPQHRILDLCRGEKIVFGKSRQVRSHELCARQDIFEQYTQTLAHRMVTCSRKTLSLMRGFSAR